MIEEHLLAIIYILYYGLIVMTVIALTSITMLAIILSKCK